MAHESIPVDIRGVDDLEKLAEEVRRTRTPRILTRADEVIAVLSPARRTIKRPPIRRKSAADIAAFLSSAGGWKDVVDTDKLRADIAESHRLPIKPRPEL